MQWARSLPADSGDLSGCVMMYLKQLALDNKGYGRFHAYLVKSGRIRNAK